MINEAPVVTPSAPAPQPDSDAAFGKRMKDRLDALLAHPYQFLPSYQDRYTTMQKYCDSLTPQQAYAMTMLIGKDSAAGYPDMPNTGELQFPAVNAWQPKAQTGWYYFAGHCHGKDGKIYGIMFMIFGYALLPPNIMEAAGLDDLQNQIADMQLGITVEGGNFYQADPVVTAGTSGKISYTADSLDFKSESCSAVSTEPGKLFPLRIRARGTDRSTSTDLEIDFTLSSGKAYLPQGFDGACPLVAGVGTRYYSIPGIVLDASASTLSIGGDAVPLESGVFWMDHQWGLGMLPGCSPRYPVFQAAGNLSAGAPPGWDFFALNMDDGSALTLSSIHTAEMAGKFNNQTGPEPPGAMTLQVAGKFMDVFGTVFNASGQLVVDKWVKTSSTPNPDKYVNIPTWVPHSAVFTLIEGVLPEQYRSIAIQHICTNAQSLWYGSGFCYVEAAVLVLDAIGTRIGAGYQEAVGYPNPLVHILSLAGLPTTPEILALFQTPPVSWSLWIESLAYWLANSDAFKTILAEGSMPPAPRTAGNMPPATQAIHTNATHETVTDALKSHPGVSLPAHVPLRSIGAL